jgi:hypothetical protein
VLATAVAGADARVGIDSSAHLRLGESCRQQIPGGFFKREAANPRRKFSPRA